MKYGAPQGSILGLCCSLYIYIYICIYIYIYIHDLPLRINSVSEQTLFADDSSGTFITKNSTHFALYIGFKENYKQQLMNITFFGLHVENHLNWWNVMEETIPKRSGACYAVRSLLHVMLLGHCSMLCC